MKRRCLLLLAIAAPMLTPVLAEANYADFDGGVAIGSSYAGVDSAPTNGLIIQGNVGIGTTSPNATLSVYDGNFSVTGSGKTPLSGTSNNYGIYTYVDTGHTSYIDSLSSGANNTFLQIRTYNNGTYNNSLFLDNLGNVGIDNTSPAHLLHVGSSSASGIVMELQNSSGACTYNPGASSVTVSCTSDSRLKSGIEDTLGGLAWLDDMRIRDFTVKATGERKTGVIAQELLETHPAMVHDTEDGLYSVDQPNPWVLVKAVQDLHGLILAQQREIAELKKKIEQLQQKQ